MRTVPGEGRLERTSCARVKKRRRRYERGTVTDRRRCFKQTSFRYFDICRTLRGVREVIEKGYSRAKNVAKPPPIPLKTSTRVHGVKRRGGHNASVITQNPPPRWVGYIRQIFVHISRITVTVRGYSPLFSSIPSIGYGNPNTETTYARLSRETTTHPPPRRPVGDYSERRRDVRENENRLSAAGAYGKYFAKRRKRHRPHAAREISFLRYNNRRRSFWACCVGERQKTSLPRRPARIWVNQS